MSSEGGNEMYHEDSGFIAPFGAPMNNSSNTATTSEFMPEVIIPVTVPECTTAGEEFEVRVGSKHFLRVRCPLHSHPSETLQVRLPVIAASSVEDEGACSIRVPDVIEPEEQFFFTIEGHPPFAMTCPSDESFPCPWVVPPPYSVDSDGTVTPTFAGVLSGRRVKLHELCTMNRASNNFDGGSGGRTPVGNEISQRIQNLPALASTFYDLDTYEWNDRSRTILAGVLDKESPLSSLIGKEETLVDSIMSFLASKWGRKVTLTMPAFAIGLPDVSWDRDSLLKFCETNDGSGWPSIRHISSQELWMDPSGQRLQGLVAYCPLRIVEKFPDPKDRNINMMPFIFGDKSSLPEEFQCYHNLIEQCPYNEEELGMVGYLTIHESFVEESKAQRREGIHIETPGEFPDEESSTFLPGIEHSWGMGYFYGWDKFEGGIFMASTVDDTSEVWDALVDKRAKGIVDVHGGCEHLRHLLGPGRKLKAKELIWMTDCTPHEALPQKESGYRQFFRVVTSNISHWFAEHSTPNPLVPLPDDVIVVHGSKFSK